MDTFMYCFYAVLFLIGIPGATAYWKAYRNGEKEKDDFLDAFCTILFGKFYTDSDEYYYSKNKFSCYCDLCTRNGHRSLYGRRNGGEPLYVSYCYSKKCEICPDCKRCTQTRPCDSTSHVPIINNQKPMIMIKR